MRYLKPDYFVKDVRNWISMMYLFHIVGMIDHMRIR